MKKHFQHIIITLIAALYTLQAFPQENTPPPYYAWDLKAERIKLVNDAIKLTWKMDTKYTGDFVVGRSEKELSRPEDVLQSQLIGTFNSSQEGILIDRGLQQGKKYYYVIIAKEDLFKRNINILKDINCTTIPVSLFAEPGPVDSIKASISSDNTVKITWEPVRGEKINYNIYRSKSAISTRADLEVAEKISTTDKNSYTDTNMPEYGTYFYAITITDKNDIEYYTPSADRSYTSKGVYIKGRTLTTPLNTGAFLGQKNSIIVKWERGNSLTGREITGYEIYRSDEMINSLLKLKFAQLIAITDASATLYTDVEPGPGKYYYAVFARYGDGTVDISFDTDLNYTRSPVIISVPFTITAMEAELADNRVIIKWNYTGNSGNETVTLFRTRTRVENSGALMPDSIIGNENIRTGTYTYSLQGEGKYYYGLFLKDENRIIQLKPGINITVATLGTSKEKEETAEKENGTVIADKEIPAKEEKAVEEKEEKAIEETPEKEEHVSTEQLDYIIDNYFYRERYYTAVKELNIFISKTDNKYEKARARLFLARTYIELEEYGKSVKLLNLDDVKTFFPEESKFWSDFAMARIR